MYSGDPKTSCAACPLNASCASGSTAIHDCACDPGHWNENQWPKSNPTACALCAPGSTTDTLTYPGAKSCTACEMNEYSPNSTASCAALGCDPLFV